ncbi:MAG: nickel-dependent lactate racemase [Pyrinomonadaceae bacterium]|nr:nickel-dependent lactate racemase [Pyrinomonadaceae bacterium]
MPVIDLKYGRTIIPFEYDPDRFELLVGASERRPLTDVEIGERLDQPIGSRQLEEIIGPGQTVLIVVPDATRQAGAGQMVNLLVRRLIANGTVPHDIRAIIATGIHRTSTKAEKDNILTPFITQRIKVLDHDANSIMNRVRVGETAGGIKVELNRALTEHDHVILVGGISFHYFAGFTGGRKLVCPGLASRQTISATHELAFDCESRDRRSGVGTGRLDGNPVHEAFVEAASKINISFCISTIINDAGEVTDLYCGDWKASHRAACDDFAAKHTITVNEKRDIVIASCGGFPHDINIIQAHKALEAASHACTEGGTIVLLAECSEGLGRSDFLSWFESADSRDLSELLCNSYQVNGQTAWSLLKKAERFDVRLISTLSADMAEAMRLTPMQSLTRTIAKTKPESKGYILPSGSKINVVCS